MGLVIENGRVVGKGAIISIEENTITPTLSEFRPRYVPPF